MCGRRIIATCRWFEVPWMMSQLRSGNGYTTAHSKRSCERTRPAPRYGLMKEEGLPEGIDEDIDELEVWQASWEDGDSEIRDPISYWQGRKRRFPRLSQVALDFLTIQPMSAECEILFAAAGRMVVPLRCRLDADVIGMCGVLRSWLRAGVIDDLDVLPVPMEKNGDEAIEAREEGE
jgi:hypothetical protein